MTSTGSTTEQAAPESQDTTTHWAADHAKRYMEARYGKDVWYSAPENFGAFERWVYAVASNEPEAAEEQMAKIEAHFAEARHA